MEKINGFWTDANNNKWDALIYSEQEAETQSKTLTNCSGCTGCTGCSGCTRCTRCSDCARCSDCSGCTGCTGCSGCRYCTRCSDCARCSDCSDCLGCRYCSGCTRCARCSGCTGYKTNPARYVSPSIGSRSANTSVYWTTKDDVQVVCGCFRGSLETFEEAVKKTHKNNPVHRKNYLLLISVVRTLINTPYENN